jgi:DNA-binding MarR family transcriptional regulator
MSMYIEGMDTINRTLDLKLEALSSELRRLILGLIYTDGPIYQSDILKHVGVASNKLAYHLNILRAAGLINREYGRNGRNVSTYSIKEDGTRFLKNIGALDELKSLTKQEFRPTNRQPFNRPRRLSETRHRHTGKPVSRRKVITA